MFERYSEKSRRVIFFARYEASQCGSAEIGTEHLLLGLVREGRDILVQLVADGRFPHTLQEEIKSKSDRGRRVSTSIEMPLSPDCRQALNLASEEATKMGQKWIAPEHLLLGMLRVEKSAAAALLHAHKRSVMSVKEWLVKEGLRPGPALGTALPRLENATTVLQSFLNGLRAGLKETTGEMLSPSAQFIDAWGRRWSGQEELNAKFDELFAPFAARNASYLLEDTVDPAAGLCVATLLWKELALPEQSLKGLCRMVVTLGRSASGHAEWVIHSLQLTPLQNRES